MPCSKAPCSKVLKVEFSRYAKAAARLAGAGLMGFLLLQPRAGNAAGTMLVGVDEAKLHRTGAPVGTVIVGNPLIADVTVQASELLVITGKNYGTTNLILLDLTGEVMDSYDVTVGSSGVNTVTLHRGGARASYNCSPRCERELDVGDATVGYNELKAQINDKNSLSRGQGAANGASGPQ